MSNHLRSTALSNYLNTNKYGEFYSYFNSSNNSRGVGIIISKKLKFSILEVIRDPCENFILLDMSIEGFRFTLGSIYAPSNKPETFFKVLTSTIDNIKNSQVILGGDFNTTPCDSMVDLNPDLFNHKGANLNGSKILNDWMSRSNKVEPFRMLHPFRREYSFKLGVGPTATKSRIDFFLISTELMKYVHNTSYELTPNKIFDHLSTTLSFQKPAKKPYRIFISDKIANSEESLRIVRLALTNLLVTYWNNEPNVDLIQISSCLNSLNHQIYQLRSYLIHNFDAMMEEILEHKIFLFNSSYQQLNIEQLISPWPLSISPPMATEMVLNDVKLAISDFCKCDTLKKRRRKDYLLSSLNNAKNALNHDSDLIDGLEAELQTLINNSTGILKKNSIDSIKEISQGNISSVSKALNKLGNTNINEIKDESGADFENENDLSSHIHDFYENIYSNTPPTTLNIEQFCVSIGESISPPEVLENTFTPLTTPISAAELTAAIAEQNVGGAAGIDKVPASLIKKIAPAILPLLLISFNFVLNGEGDFSSSAKSSKIKLIPKKSDLSSIANWRPISLTNTLYKLYCKIISKRLAKVLPSILGPSQKAYLKNNIITESSNNLLEFIANNKNNNTPTYLTSLDFTKAFDSLSHKSISQALSFFNFPENFIKIIETWLSNRKAAVILGHNKLSEFFPIRCGIPQGDPLSGYIFIIVIELLIIKLNSFPDLKTTATLAGGTPPLFTEGFADDLLNFIRCSAEALNIYKQIVMTFGNATNLKLNLLKTKTMIIGNNSNYAHLIANQCGFQICNKLTHLGLIIDDKLEELSENWDFKLLKIKKLKNMLLSLKPNLTMKIALSKVFLYSQATYLAASIIPKESHLNLLRKIILDFLYPKKPLFSAERTFSSKLQAGLNLPPISDFMNSIALNFALRSRFSQQPWAIEVKRHFLDLNPLNALLPIQNSTSLNSFKFAKLINSFNTNFFTTYSDIWSAPFFNSPVIKNTCNNRFIPVPGEIVGTPLTGVLLSDLYNFKEKRILTPYEIGVKYNIFMSQVTHFRIAGALFHNLPPRSSRPEKKPLPKTLGFFLSKKQSAKSVRKICFPEKNTIQNFQHIKVLNSYVDGNFITKKQIRLSKYVVTFLSPA